MSLTVQHLNADTTFLLAFAPAFAPSNKKSKHFPGAFNILIDPWLAGESSILHPSFQISHHTTTSSVSSLADLKDEIDLIIISQDKPDHCHRETLCSLPKNKQVNILATPAAAKKIKSWRYFNDEHVHVMPEYSHRKPSSVICIQLPAYTSRGKPGEITIAHMPTKLDLTGLHNALGITYRPPSTIFSSPASDQIDLGRPSTSTTPSTTATNTPSSHSSRPTTSSGKTGRARTNSSPTQPPRSLRTLRSRASAPNLKRKDSATFTPPLPTTQTAEPTLSVLYTPHGVSPSLIQTYASHHLFPLNALPFTAIFHAFTAETNLWFLSGKVVTGAPGGLELCRRFGVKTWISAHDEVKDNKGLSVKWIKSRAFGVEDVRSLVEEAGECVEVVNLEVGAAKRVAP